MTAQQIVDAYRSGPQTDLRLAKARALAIRMNVDWTDVEALLNPPAKT